jgi:hypothetical protein
MAYSTIPDAKDGYIAALQARSGLAGVLVEWGVPMEVPAIRERVYVDDATNVDRQWVALGQNRLDEQYDLQVIVEVYQEGDDRRATELRMWAVVAEVEQCAVVDLRLAVANWDVPKPRTDNPRLLPTGDGWLSTVTLLVECSARIHAT